MFILSNSGLRKACETKAAITKKNKLCFKLSFCLCLNLYGSESRYDTYGHFKLKASAVRKKKSRPPAVKAPVCEG